MAGATSRYQFGRLDGPVGCRCALTSPVGFLRFTEAQAALTPGKHMWAEQSWEVGVKRNQWWLRAEVGLRSGTTEPIPGGSQIVKVCDLGGHLEPHVQGAHQSPGECGWHIWQTHKGAVTTVGKLCRTEQKRRKSPQCRLPVLPVLGHEPEVVCWLSLPEVLLKLEQELRSALSHKHTSNISAT